MIQQEPEEAEVENVETLRQSLAEEKEKAENYLTNWQRAQADFLNYKRRSEEEKKEVNQLANSALMLSLLPALDDLERAFTSIPPDLVKLGWVDGIRLIKQKLRASLEAQGLSPIQALGEPFDPKLHQAVMHGKGQEGIVVEELQKGYQLYDRILRPTMVVVGEGDTEEKSNSESEESDTLV